MKDLKSVLIGALVLCLLGIGYQCGINRAAKKEIKTIISQAEISAKTKDVQIADQSKDIADLKKTGKILLENITAVNKRVDKLDVELTSERKKNIEIQKKLESAPPEELVTEARRNLGTKEIWLSGENVIFTMPPFRLAVQRLSEWESFSTVQAPKMAREIEELKVNAENYRKEKIVSDTIIAAKDTQLDLERQKYADLKFSFGQYIQASKKPLLSKVFDFILKAGFGFALGKL